MRRALVALVLVLAACTAPSTSDAGMDAGSDGGVDAFRVDAGHDTGVDVGPRCDPMDAGASIDVCNGSAALCDRRFDEVAYLTTHNAMSNAEDRFILPNQTYPIYRQLEDGVRGMMLDVHENADGAVSLCHGDCRFGQRLLVDGLRDIREFLDCHPREVLTIIFESYVPESAIAQGFEDSGLIRYVRAQPQSDPWPTLRELIAANERMVVFTADTAHAAVAPLLVRLRVGEPVPRRGARRAELCRGSRHARSLALDLQPLPHGADRAARPRGDDQPRSVLPGTGGCVPSRRGR